MAHEIVLPQWGMEMQDATIVRWLKKEGDPLQEGEPPAPIRSKGRKRSESGAQTDTGESKAEEEDHGTDEMGTL